MWDEYRFYIVGAAMMVALQSALIAGLVVQRARWRRAESERLAGELRIRAASEQNQDLAGRLISARDEERARIARNLHDDLSQQLAGVAMMLSGLRRKIVQPGSRPDVDQTITALQERTSALATAITSLAHDLHPCSLPHAGLVATLRRHCAEVEHHHPLTVRFSAGADFESLNADVALCLFRVAQEALANAVRHARARTIFVQLFAPDESVELSVIDDGIGFVTSERTARGLGLGTIAERVRLAGGRVIVESRPGQGASVLVRIPLAPPETTSVVTPAASRREALELHVANGGVPQ